MKLDFRNIQSNQNIIIAEEIMLGYFSLCPMLAMTTVFIWL